MRAISAALAAVLAASAGPMGCVVPDPQAFTLTVPRGLELYAPLPEGSAPTQQRAELGRRLFFDPALSADRTIACASCHRPDASFADDRSVSPGVYGRRGRRNAPSLLNIAYARHLTWDGRSATLEEQVLEPIQDPVEMDLALDELVARLGSTPGYAAEFDRVFGEAVSTNGVALAIATYLRTLRSGDAPIDRFLGGQTNVLSAEAREGFQLFVGKARCTFCHLGPMLTDGEFHNTGVSARSGSNDEGRFARTGQPAERRAFRTASLRNVARTAPYMHDGSIATLGEVINFYDRGGGPDGLRDPELSVLRLTEDEKRGLVAFLNALTGR